MIHPSAIIEKGVKIGKNVEIGPFSIITKNVEIGSHCKIGSNVLIDGWTTLGEGCDISHGAVIGTPPQDFKYKGEKSFVHVGKNNIIREYVTIHRASDKGGETCVGDSNLLMAYVHIAHNCILGNNIVIANYTGLSGHVEIDDQAVVGGLTGIHQFCRIGRLAMVGGYSKVIKDIPPFVMADGQPARLYGINARGLRRRDISEKARIDIKKAYNLLTDLKLNLSQAIEAIKKNIKSGPEIDYLLCFLQNPSRMGILVR